MRLLNQQGWKDLGLEVRNGDGSLDNDETMALAESFAARWASSATDARDPIVYGAVASNGKILIRTGTSLGC